MDVYILLLYVTKEQENAIKMLFAKKRWLFCKSGSSHLSYSKKTVILYDDLNNSQPKIYKVSDLKHSQIFTTHKGSFIETSKENTTQHDEKQPVETVSPSPNTAATKIPAGLKECSVKLERMPGKEKTCAIASIKKKRGRPKSIKTEIKYKTSEDFVVNSTVDTVADKKIKSDTKPVSKSDAEEMGDDCDSYKDYEKGRDSSEDIENNEIDPDYHYGARFGVFQKKKRVQTKKRSTFSCEKCKKLYKFKGSYLNHIMDGVCEGPVIKKRKNDEMSGLGSYFCYVCKKTYAYKRKYNTHFIDGRCNRQCKYCDKVFSRNLLKKHVFYKHELEDQRFLCQICKKRFFEKNELTQHMHLHDSDRNFVCDFCGKAFFMYNNLYIHRRKHVLKQAGVKAHCNICNKDFNDVGYLEFHKKVTHLNVRNCMCEICGKKFKTARCVMNHMRSHSDERPFHCDVCGKYYKYSHQLSSHKKMFHSKLKRFFCKVCNKGFYFEGKLRDHMNIHTGTRAHQCPQCDYSSFTQNQLTQHKRKHRQPKNDLEKAGANDIVAEKLKVQ